MLSMYSGKPSFKSTVPQVQCTCWAWHGSESGRTLCAAKRTVCSVTFLQ